jgi:hypothetical protein
MRDSAANHSLSSSVRGPGLHDFGGPGCSESAGATLYTGKHPESKEAQRSVTGDGYDVGTGTRGR